MPAISKLAMGVSGVVLLAIVGWVIGALIEHPPGPGGLQFMGALIGVMIALAILAFGEALRSK